MMKVVPPPTTTPSLTVTTYGEATTIPIDIKRVKLAVNSSVPFLNKSLCCLELTLVNNAVRGHDDDVSAKLRLKLPPSAGVKKFEILRDDRKKKWYPATAVTKKEAAQVVYREKEKNRGVAVASNVSGSSSSQFEIEIKPLPYNVDVQCKLEIMLNNKDADVEQFVESMKGVCSKNDGNVEVEVADIEASGKQLVPSAGGGGCGGAVVGESFGKMHFACVVPSINFKDGNNKTAEAATADKEKKKVVELPRAAVLWDTSSSMKPPTGMGEDFLSSKKERLAELATKAKTTSFELYVFEVQVRHVGTFQDVDGLFDAIDKLEYDGGSYFTPVVDLIYDLASMSSSENRQQQKIDYALIVSDGVDSLGEPVPIFDRGDVPFPVHCVAAACGGDGAAVDVKSLRRLASASSRFPGTVFTEKDRSYVEGVLCPRPFLRSIRTDQDYDAFTEEYDDGFRCVPDHRLLASSLKGGTTGGIINRPIGNDGFMICGILGDEKEGKLSTVSEIVAEVVVAGTVHEFHYKLVGDDKAKLPSSSSTSSSSFADQHSSVVRHYMPTIRLEKPQAREDMTPSSVNPARILGHVYAEELYDEAEKFGLKSGMDTKAVREELAVSYGFCSPESSLLMLYDVDQFLENKILPPVGHPLHDDPMIVERLGKPLRDGSRTLKNVPEAGEIGGLKTEDQKRKVVELSQRLETFLKSPIDRVDVTSMPTPFGGAFRGGDASFNAFLASTGAAAPTAARMAGAAAAMAPMAPMGGVAAPTALREMVREEGMEEADMFDAAADMAGAAAAMAPMGTCRLFDTAAPSVEPPSSRTIASIRNLFSGAPPSAYGGASRRSERRERSSAAPRSTHEVRSCALLASADDEMTSEEGMDLAGGLDVLHALESDAEEEDMNDMEELVLESCSYSVDAEEEDMNDMEELVLESCSYSVSVRNNPPGSDRRSCKKKKSRSSEPALSGSSRVVGPPQDPKAFTDALSQALSEEKDESAWQLVYEAEKAKLGGFRHASPSFFLNSARVLIESGKSFDAIRVVTNCLESNIEEVQMLRSVGYMLLATETDDGLRLAITVFDRIRDLSPCEPQSFLDSALARFFSAWQRACSPNGGGVTTSDKASNVAVQQELAAAQELLVRVILHKWADRFEEVEWPALILLHYIADFAKDYNEKFSPLCAPEWPSKLEQAFGGKSFRFDDFDISLMVWLGWDTDKTDIDLHVKEPSGNEVYYGNKRGFGSLLSRDLTQGYGPEVYVLKGSGATNNRSTKMGNYEIFAKYYSSHQDSNLTGATSAVVWMVEKGAVGSRKMNLKFRFVRLKTHQQKTHVATAVAEQH